MAGNDMLFSFGKPKPRRSTAARETVAHAESCSTAETVVLDMGEASREEGFRQNGCR
jgi:hypothetical protein